MSLYFVASISDGVSKPPETSRVPWTESFEAGLESFEAQNWDESTVKLEEVIAGAPFSTQLAEAYVLRGAIDKLKGQPQAAVRQYQNAFEVYKKTNHWPLAARQLVNLANTYKDSLSQFGLALRHYEEAEDIFTEYGLEDERLSAVIDRGNTYLDMGNSSRALSTLQNSLARLQPNTQWESWTRAALMVARVHYRRGAYDVASQYINSIEKILEQVIPTFEREPHPSARIAGFLATLKIDLLNLRALVAGESGLGLQAIEILKKAVLIDGIALQKQATLYNNLGYWLREEGAPEEALLAHQKALVIDRSLYPGENANLAYDYRNIGMDWLAQGEDSVAAGYLHDALGLSLNIGIPYNGAFSALGLGEIAARGGRWSEAQSYYHKAYELANAVGAKNLEWVALSQAGAVSFYQGSADQENLMDDGLSQLEMAYDLAQQLLGQMGQHSGRLAFKKSQKYQALLATYKDALRGQGRDRESVAIETEYGEGF